MYVLEKTASRLSKLRQNKKKESTFDKMNGLKKSIVVFEGVYTNGQPFKKVRIDEMWT